MTNIDFDYSNNDDFGIQRKWDLLCINFSLEAANTLSKCAAKKVAALIANNDSILSVGVNGTFPGFTNCNELFKKEDSVWYKKDENNNWKECSDQNEHHNWSLHNEIHAEINALSKLSRMGIPSDGLTLYCTHFPCFNCAKSIITSGIKRIVYVNEYDNFPDVMNLLNISGIETVQYEMGES